MCATRQGSTIWTTRRKIARNVYKVMPSPVSSNIDTKTKDEKSSLDTTIIASTFLFVIIFAVIRYGGRAALLNLLGLDFIVDASIKEQIDSFVNFFDSLGFESKIIYFQLGWIVAKLSCIDTISIGLAFSSGILFHGLLPGTLASVGCGTVASIIGFYIGRTFLKSNFQNKIKTVPSLRAVANSITKNSFQTVFALRLSPILPLPIGAYNYLYGATDIKLLPFICGSALGSVKPMVFDSYLGLFGKSILDKDAGSNDYVLLGAIFAVLLAGTFATQIVSSTIEEIKRETALESMTNSSSITSNPITRILNFFELQQKLPTVLNDVTRDLEKAWDRIDTVLGDEYNVTSLETNQDVDKVVDWNGNVNYLFQHEYPGNRTIFSWEMVPPSADNIKEYTYESLLFSFVLLGRVFK